MNSFEFNKIFAAALTAGVVAMLGGFIADQIVPEHMPAEDAVPIEGVVSTGGGDAGPKGPGPIMALIASADLAKGEKLAKACAACHDFTSGGANKVGPNLYGVVGHPKGAHAGFEYSSGLKEKGGVWDFESLNYFLYKPKEFIAGTKMNFAGFKKDEDRAAVVAWLHSLGSSMAMPSAAQIAAEAAALAPPAPAAPAEGAAETPAAPAPAEAEKPAEKAAH